VTNPTSHDQNDEPRWWLELDDGELLAVDDKMVSTFRQGDGRESVLLRLPTWRAHDLSLVLQAYSRMMALADQVRHVSVGEERLGSALHDASLAALGRDRDEHNLEPHKVSSAARLRGMAVLQSGRPWLTHAALLGVVDAAAWWLDQNEDDLAVGLLEAAGGEDFGQRAWAILLDLKPPGSPSADQSEGLPS